MPIDVLQDVLDTIRLQGLIAVHDFIAPWGYITTPDSYDIAFLVMIEGNGLFEVEEANLPVRALQSGDIVMLPRGNHYILRDQIHSPVRPFMELKAQRQTAFGPRTRIAKGCYRFVGSRSMPIFSVLPPLIHLRQQDYQSIPELDLIVHLFLIEASHENTSQPVILSRMAEVLFMHMLRQFTTQHLEGASGWLRGLADPPIAAALQAMHANPAEAWTVERLAKEAHLSRSAFAERFRAIVGESPIQYLQRWRMQRAAYLLHAGNLPLKTVITQSGYASEEGFRKAFQQWMGMLPSQYLATKKGVLQSEEIQEKVEAVVPKSKN